MGKKYIIELEDNELAYHTIIIDRTPYIKSLQLLPYTELDTEQVRKEAYEQGYEKCLSLNNFGHRCVNCDKYEQGLADAWEAARKISHMDSKTGDEIFDRVITSNIFDENTASEAIEKIRQYEQEQEEIQVGDEVVSEDDIKAIVIDMDDYLLHVLDENGVVQGWPREDVAKTDCHFPEIATVLEKMREK